MDFVLGLLIGTAIGAVVGVFVGGLYRMLDDLDKVDTG